LFDKEVDSDPEDSDRKDVFKKVLAKNKSVKYFSFSTEKFRNYEL
jgi:hypothetical protein